jgi:hypothetical protein
MVVTASDSKTTYHVEMIMTHASGRMRGRVRDELEARLRAAATIASVKMTMRPGSQMKMKRHSNVPQVYHLSVLFILQLTV